jgi:hypothetical protein
VIGEKTREFQSSEPSGALLGTEADLLFGRRGRRDELLDRFEDNRELLVVFFLERFDLAREIAVCVHEPAELNERAHDRDVYFDRAGAAKHPPTWATARQALESIATPCSVKVYGR